MTMKTSEEVYRQPWMNDENWECAEFLADMHKGWHHLPGKIKRHGAGVEINTFRTMSTFDFDDLTRLVFLAHDRCIRIEIKPSGPGRVKLCLWKRARKVEGMSMWEYHPTLETAVKDWREHHPITQPL